MCAKGLANKDAEEDAEGLVSPVGIEPTTNWLKANCSTTELRARKANRGAIREHAKYTGGGANSRALARRLHACVELHPVLDQEDS
jgi:hypothetical protein